MPIQRVINSAVTMFGVVVVAVLLLSVTVSIVQRPSASLMVTWTGSSSADLGSCCLNPGPGQSCIASMTPNACADGSGPLGFFIGAGADPPAAQSQCNTACDTSQTSSQSPPGKEADLFADMTCGCAGAGYTCTVWMKSSGLGPAPNANATLDVGGNLQITSASKMQGITSIPIAMQTTTFVQWNPSVAPVTVADQLNATITFSPGPGAGGNGTVSFTILGSDVTDPNLGNNNAVFILASAICGGGGSSDTVSSTNSSQASSTASSQASSTASSQASSTASSQASSVASSQASSAASSQASSAASSQASSAASSQASSTASSQASSTASSQASSTASSQASSASSQASSTLSSGGSSSRATSSSSASTSSRATSSSSGQSSSANRSSAASSSSKPTSCSRYECIFGAKYVCQGQSPPTACQQLSSGTCFVCSGTCGNKAREPNETCDDGNTRDGDGCDHACALEDIFCAPGGGSSSSTDPISSSSQSSSFSSSGSSEQSCQWPALNFDATATLSSPGPGLQSFAVSVSPVMTDDGIKTGRVTINGTVTLPIYIDHSVVGPATGDLQVSRTAGNGDGTFTLHIDDPVASVSSWNGSYWVARYYVTYQNATGYFAPFNGTRTYGAFATASRSPYILSFLVPSCQ